MAYLKNTDIITLKRHNHQLWPVLGWEEIHLQLLQPRQLPVRSRHVELKGEKPIFFY